MFTVAEDKKVLCWDLEYNKVIRHYHGHLSGVYAIGMHPSIDIIVTGGRDGTARVWDIRTKSQIHCLAGHTGAVGTLLTQSTDPQVITGSHDSQIRTWDLAAGKVRTVLTNHKKAVRAMVMHPTEYTFASGSVDNVKKWKLPEAMFMSNLSGHKAIINTLAVNKDGVLVSSADNGTMYFWDWKSGYNFQRMETQAQPGSLESEAGIFASTFDRTGSRLFTCEADKSIKVWREDEEATPESHPLNWKPTRQTKY
jgi:pleiotropic regulator 1